MKRWLWILPEGLLLMLIFNCCSIADVTKGEREKVEYTVVAKNEIPSEIEEIISERKETEFQRTCTGSGYLYILR